MIVIFLQTIKSMWLKIACVCLVGLSATVLFAFDASDLRVENAYNSPFIGAFELNNLTDEDIKSIRVETATPEDYTAFSEVYPEVLNQAPFTYTLVDAPELPASSLRFRIDNPVVLSSSTLSLLLKITFGEGLAPSFYKYQISPMTPPGATTPSPVSNTTAVSSAPPSPGATVDIVKNDTLRNISQTTKNLYYPNDTNITTEQIMTALYRDNASLFSGYEVQPNTRIVLPAYDNIISQSNQAAFDEIASNYRPARAPSRTTTRSTTNSDPQLVLSESENTNQLSSQNVLFYNPDASQPAFGAGQSSNNLVTATPDTTSSVYGTSQSFLSENIYMLLFLLVILLLIFFVFWLVFFSRKDTRPDGFNDGDEHDVLMGTQQPTLGYPQMPYPPTLYPQPYPPQAPMPQAPMAPYPPRY